MSLWQGVKGAQIELAAVPGPARKLRRLARIAGIFGQELLGTLALAPYALRARSLYASLPDPSSSAADAAADAVYLVRGQRYSDAAPRNTLDLYLPADAVAAAASGGGDGAPAVVFVHGGVWAAGESWHYAPLATCLARLGVLVAVVQYSLYPSALVPQMVAEVGAAYDWAVEQGVRRYGGDPGRITLVGHSAGAQLCMTALLQRAAAAEHEARGGGGGGGERRRAVRMPRKFVAVAGVYDIARHYSYEEQRGVHELSTMKRAMGGFSGFAAMSPAVVLAAALHAQEEQKEQQQQQQQQQQQGARRAAGGGGGGGGGGAEDEEQPPPACSFYSNGGFQLAGEAIAHRVGCGRGCDGGLHEAREAEMVQRRLGGMQGVLRFPLEAAAHLPPIALLSSCTDLTVPWYESSEMYWQLLECGAEVKHLVYNKVGHGDFVVDWPSALGPAAEDWGASGGAGAGSEGGGTTAAAEQDWGGGGGEPARRPDRRALLLEQLPPYLRDIAVLAMDEQPVAFDTRRRRGARGSEAAADARPRSADAEVVVAAADLN